MAQMIIKLANLVAQIANASDKDNLYTALATATKDIGFAGFNLTCKKNSPRDFMSDPMLTNFATNDLVEYVDERWAERDPLLLHATTGKFPLLWSTTQWEKTPYTEYDEYIRAKGVPGGVTVPLSGQDATFSAMTLIAPTHRAYDEQIAHAAAIIGVIAMARAGAIGLICGPATTEGQERLRTLTGHQMEVLKWIANGKSTFEIALIMGKSKRVTEYHVSEILRKLEVRTRAQAVAIYAQM